MQLADALSAGPVAFRERLPLLLTAPDRLPAATREALLADEGSGTSLQQVVVVGGEGAVSPQVVREVEALGLRVRRISGADRQRTAIAVFEFAEVVLVGSADAGPRRELEQQRAPLAGVVQGCERAEEALPDGVDDGLVEVLQVDVALAGVRAQVLVERRHPGRVLREQGVRPGSVPSRLSVSPACPRPSSGRRAGWSRVTRWTRQPGRPAGALPRPRHRDGQGQHRWSDRRAVRQQAGTAPP